MAKTHKNGYLLTLDRGNSALKADVWSGNTIVETIVMAPSYIYRQLKTLLSRHEIDGAMYCSVTDDGAQFFSLFDEAGVPFFQFNLDIPIPLAIDYKTRNTLGVDRIAGAIGAYTLSHGKELMVIDLGTAITYDRVTSNGTFIGGNIAPGVSLRLKALNAFTARLPRVNLEGDVPLWGYDTDTALRSGAIRGIAAEVSYYCSQLPADSEIFITGGSAPRIAPYLDMPYTMEPHLVPIGLKSCLDKHVLELNTINS